MSGLQILEVKKPKQKPDTAPEPLPPHPFLWGVVAPPKSGKSNMIMSIIGASHMYGRDYFDEIYYLSPSQNFDNSTRHVLPKLDNLIQIDNPDTLENADVIVRAIMKQQADDPPEERKKVLIILDDMAGTLEKNKVLQKLSCKYRHYNCSLFFSVQQYKSLPVMIRNCLTCFTHFHIPNEKEYTKMNEELHDRFPNGAELGRLATRQRYNFCFMNIEKAQIWHNFDTCLYDKETDPDYD
jgi:hypothetical protein|tara:strand:- start:5121 stop:5837 length:717 start_codon:yes stop_codon:yes gene_type:complete